MWTKRILTAAVLLGLVGLVAADAQWGGRRGRTGGRMGQLQDAPTGPLAQLELTEDQQAAIQALRQTRLEQMQGLRQAGTLDREAAQAAWEEHRQAVFDILTPAQQSRLEELRAQAPPRGAFGGKGMRGRPGARGGAFAQLELNEDQQVAIQALRQTQREQMQAWREAGTLDREAIQAAREEHHQAILGILTPDQQTRLEELRAQAPQLGMRGRRGARGGALLQLGLSEDQQAAVQALRQTQREQMQALRLAGTLDCEAVQAAREEHHRALVDILTPDQQARLEELRAQAPQPGMRGRRGPGAWGPGTWGHCPLGADTADEAGDATTDGATAGDDFGYRLRPPSPNPFNPETHIAFELPAPAQVQLEVYDVLGRRVRTLVSESFGAGTHSVVWDGRNDSGQGVAGGAYFARLVADGHQSTQRMLLLK